MSVPDVASAALPRGPVVAVIPARGGSKGIPGKNLAVVGGVPLVVRAVFAALAAPSVDVVVVSTDSPTIARAAEAAGATVVDRPTGIAGDTASSETAVQHALGVTTEQSGQRPSVAVLVQATSPFIAPETIDRAVTRVLTGAEDVVFSAVSTHGFLWCQTDGDSTGVNHDRSSRPRRQDREPEFLETGAFYAMRYDGFDEIGHRFFGRVGIEEVDPAHTLEIDTLPDLRLAQHLATMTDRTLPHLTPPFAEVEALVTDFDGVHTDDSAAVDQDGREHVVVSRSDGMGFALLRETGLPILILSTETNGVVTRRAAKLKVEVLQSSTDKAASLLDWLRDRGIDPRRTVYVGNDVNDLAAMRLVGYPVAVPGSHPAVLAAARYVLTRQGGRGAVRELTDLILTSKGQLT